MNPNFIDNVNIVGRSQIFNQSIHLLPLMSNLDPRNLNNYMNPTCHELQSIIKPSVWHVKLFEKLQQPSIFP